jgi:hypothetical protein
MMQVVVLKQLAFDSLNFMQQNLPENYSPILVEAI